MGGKNESIRGGAAFRISAENPETISLSVSKGSGKLPQVTVRAQRCALLTDLPPADDFGKPGKVENILGEEVLSSVLKGNHLRKGSTGPVALHATLGYELKG